MQIVQEGNRTQFDYNLAWARTHLKNLGLIVNSSRGVWALTKAGWDASTAADGVALPGITLTSPAGPSALDDETEADLGDWRTELLKRLLALSPKAFEHFCMRVLRESGFVDVEVTSYSKDGGIDGRGIARFQGLLSFYVAFQCKRYSGAVGAPEVQAFRGAWIGQADRGLLMTTGRFTGPAQAEALRPGAPPIDLVDGYILTDKMKELSLGVKTTLVEEVSIEVPFFSSLEP